MKLSEYKVLVRYMRKKGWYWNRLTQRWEKTWHHIDDHHHRRGITHFDVLEFRNQHELGNILAYEDMRGKRELRAYVARRRTQ